MNYDSIRAAFKAQNSSLTLQRKVILETLNQSKEHLSAEEIYWRVKKPVPDISLGTVYRNLELLAQLDFVDQINLRGQKKLYEIKKPPHYHIVCDNCGRIEDLTGIHINKLEQEISRATGYDISDHALSLIGTCPDCLRSGRQIPIQNFG